MRSRPPKPPKRANGLLKTNSRCYRAIHRSALIRGNFHAGWNPSAVPEKYHAEAYARGSPVRRSSPPAVNLFRKRRRLHGGGGFQLSKVVLQLAPQRFNRSRGGHPASTHHEPFMIHCLAASICPAGKCLISADTKCDVKCSATSPMWESVTTPILLMRL